MAIPDEKIEEVRTAVDLVEVAEDYVQLKQSGSRYMGLCPFHNEDTPSFSVDPDQNLYYCFGCQNGGDAFKFVQEIEGVGFLESVRMLADRYGVPLPEEETDPDAANEREAVLHALRFAARFFYRQLTQSDRGRPALDYLRRRGFTPQTIKQFGLGYAPDEWDALLTVAEEEQIDRETLEKAGLIIERNDGSGYYDRYRGRIIFPIFSHIGKVLAFAGRILDPDDERDQPKYINSPETEVYHKKEVLYGLHQAKRTVRDQEVVGIVEGYTDVINMWQHGVKNVVATCGTSLTKEHVKKIERWADEVFFIYDGDSAGAEATLRGANVAFEKGIEVNIVSLPDGEDPDSFISEFDSKDPRDEIKNRTYGYHEFVIDRAKSGGEFDSPVKQSKTIDSILKSVAKIPDKFLKDRYVREISEIVNTYDDNLFRKLKKFEEELKEKKKYRKKRSQPNSSIKRKKTSSSPPGNSSSQSQQKELGKNNDNYENKKSSPLPEERVLLRLMLENGRRMVDLVLGHMALDEFSEGAPRDFARAFAEMYEDGTVRPQQILNGEHGEALQQLGASVMMDEHEASEHWAQKEDISVPHLNDRPYEAARSAMKFLKMDRVDEAIEAVRERMYQASQQGADEEVQRLQQKMMSLQELRKGIKRGEFLED